MAQISYENISYNDSNAQSNVGFFNLKHDGEEAVVRFMIDSVQDMDLQTVHSVTVNGKFRQVSCLRNPMDDMNACPLCARGDRVQQAFFIRMLQYVRDDNGNIQVKPVVWQRNASVYAPKLKGYLDNYGPLSQIVCKIIRHGQPGDMKTTYDIIPALNPNEYTAEKYPIDFSMFEDFNVLGRMVMEKSFADLNTFVTTGSMPEKISEPQENVMPRNKFTERGQYQGANFAPSQEQQMERPQRYY